MIFPEKCISCGNEGEIICKNCAGSIERLNKQECPYCRKENSDGKLCAKLCSGKYYFNYLLVCTRYSEKSIIKALIKKYKYKNKKGLYLFFGQILVRELKNFLLNNPQNRNAIIVPVPISSKKLKIRGYNQCKLIAKFVADEMGMEFLDILTWTNYQGQQAGRKYQERIKSRAGTMEIKKGYIEKIQGKSLIIIDDIASTCSTVNECARVFKKYFVAPIIVFVISRSKKNLLR